jgi:hypothetical protein
VAIRIPIIADVIDALRGAKKLGESFEDVADSLDEVTTGARPAGAAVEDVGDHAGATSRDAAEMERSFKDAFDSVRKESKDAGDGVSDSMRHGTEGASASVEEFGSEANSTAKETAASFDGSAESITGAFQEIAANAFQGFGPAGAVAGLAAAAGIGIVTNRMEEAKEKAQETAQEVADIAGELIDLGSHKLGPEQVADALNEMATTAEDGKIPLDELRKVADKAGISYSDYAQGVAGDSSALQRSYDEVQGALGEYQSELDRVDKAHGHNSEASVSFRKSQQDNVGALLAASDALLEQDATLDRASTTAKNYADASAGITVQTERQAAETEHATQVQDAYRGALEGTADPVGVYEQLLSAKEDAERKTAEATAAATKDSEDSWEDYAAGVTVTTQDLIDEWNRQAAENAAFAENLAIIGANGGQALADELKAKGPEVAAATAAAIAQSDPATQRQAIDAHAAATGVAMGVSLATGVTSQKAGVQMAVDGVAAGMVAPSVALKLRLDTAQAVKDYDTYVRNLPPVKVQAHGPTQQAV